MDFSFQRVLETIIIQIQTIHSYFWDLYPVSATFAVSFLLLVATVKYLYNYNALEEKLNQCHNDPPFEENNLKYVAREFRRNSKQFQFDTDPMALINTQQLFETIHIAACKSDVEQWAERCITLLQLEPTAVNHAMPPQNFTPFLRACSSGGITLVEYMLSNGADISLTTLDGDTPILLAVYNVGKYSKDMSLPELLLQYGCDVKTSKKNGCTPLHVAARIGNVTMIQWLIKNGADPKAKLLSSLEMTPADIAEALNNTRAAMFLASECKTKQIPSDLQLVAM